MTFNFAEGEVLLIDKPFRWTSFDAVNKIRNLIKHKLKVKKIKVGHAGTLDPLATGLLIICTGKFTKQIDEFQLFDKEYTGTFTIGATTPSSDLETEVDQVFDYTNVTEEKIYLAAKKLTGVINQTPPVFSAKKIDGVRAYELARQGLLPVMESKKVEIKSFEITKIQLPLVDFRICCSKGTYIRSIAKSFGEELENGAHLSTLCRTKIGNFLLENAYNLQEFEKNLQE